MTDHAVQAVGPDLPAAPLLARRQVVAVALGNALEFYDFITYAFFAAQIGRTFFPSDRAGVSLLASLATFGAGFLTRPLGALVIGRMGDRRGRKPAMLLSFGLIGVAVIGLPLTPSYAAIGIWAPALVVGFRLLQGFALGGEVGPSTAFLMEAAPLMRRGFYISMQAMSADAAVLAAGLVGVVLAHWLSPAQLDAWGWRLALGLGAVIVPFGWLMRRTLVETLDVADSGAFGGAARSTDAELSAGGLAGSGHAGGSNDYRLRARLHDHVRQQHAGHARASGAWRHGDGGAVRAGVRSAQRLAVGPDRPQARDGGAVGGAAAGDFSGLLAAGARALRRGALHGHRSAGDRLDAVDRHGAGGGDRIAACSVTLRRAGDDLRGGDFGLRRFHPVRGRLADATDRQPAGTGLVHDWCGGGWSGGHQPNAGDGAGQAGADHTAHRAAGC